MSKTGMVRIRVCIHPSRAYDTYGGTSPDMFSTRARASGVHSLRHCVHGPRAVGDKSYSGMRASIHPRLGRTVNWEVYQRWRLVPCVPSRSWPRAPSPPRPVADPRCLGPGPVLSLGFRHRMQTQTPAGGVSVADSRPVERVRPNGTTQRSNTPAPPPTTLTLLFQSFALAIPDPRFRWEAHGADGFQTNGSHTPAALAPSVFFPTHLLPK